MTINDIDLAWLSGETVIRSDVMTISNIDNLDFSIGGQTFSATNVTSYMNTFNMNSAYQYAEPGTPDSDDTLNVNIAADMTGHLACAASTNLGDTGGVINVDTRVGSSGVVTLKAGDANDDDAIDIADATLIGGNIATAGSKEEDVNGDSAINVLDLVHVGRNYGASSATSCGTGS